MEDEKKIPDDFLEKIKSFLFTQYIPVTAPDAETIYKTTREIFNALQALYPSIDYGEWSVAQWLNERNFVFTEMGEMQFEWMLKRVN